MSLSDAAPLPETGHDRKGGAAGPSLLARVGALGALGLARLVTGVRPHWLGCAPSAGQRIYFANHASHGDFLLVWASLPPALRRTTRPVACARYWTRNAARRFCAEQVFRAVLIDRSPAARGADPLAAMTAALDAGNSLIFFPEGTRNTGEAPLLPFKGGLYHLARARPGLDLVPVWIDNLNRVMPKGERVPVPLLCTTSFGAPLRLGATEAKRDFLARAEAALLALAPAARRPAP